MPTLNMALRYETPKVPKWKQDDKSNGHRDFKDSAYRSLKKVHSKIQVDSLGTLDCRRYLVVTGNGAFTLNGVRFEKNCLIGTLYITEINQND